MVSSDRDWETTEGIKAKQQDQKQGGK